MAGFRVTIPLSRDLHQQQQQQRQARLRQQQQQRQAPPQQSQNMELSLAGSDDEADPYIPFQSEASPPPQHQPNSASADPAVNMNMPVTGSELATLVSGETPLALVPAGPPFTVSQPSGTGGSLALVPAGPSFTVSHPRDSGGETSLSLVLAAPSFTVSHPRGSGGETSLALAPGGPSFTVSQSSGSGSQTSLALAPGAPSFTVSQPSGSGGQTSLALGPGALSFTVSHPSGSRGRVKKMRGRRGPPSSSANNDKLQALGSTEAGVGVGFTPHIFTIPPGEDIAAKIMEFNMSGPRSVCVFSAFGCISSVTLRHPTISGGTIAYEVVAITVYFLLTVVYYAFFAPFLGNKLYEYIAIGVYSFLAFLVLVLYIRCTGIDPADPGIFVRADNTPAHKSQNSNSVPENASAVDGGPYTRHGSGCCNAIGRFVCGCLVIQDCSKDTQQEQSDEQEESLFCTLCNAEVRKFSKHCRSCGKCIDVLDHHCRWLNNCVGQKNYISFVCLMAASFCWLIVEFGVGVAVFVRCFVDQKAMEHLITEKLGLGFSRPPFAAVVVVCTTLSFLAIVPLGELFLFHIILIRKGITTYEYVVALRAQTELPVDGLDQTSQPPSSTSSAVTAASGRSSLGLSIQYRGASLCTPPNIFMDQQDDVIQHLEPGPVRSTIDPDTLSQKKPPQRQQVRINPWKLAKLDSNEASKAAAKARASSSVLLPVSSQHNPCKTSSNVSGRSSPASSHQTKNTRKADKADSESCSLSSPGLTRDHFNPMYMSSSANESPLNEEESRNAVIAARRNLPTSDESTVVWDPEAGRFVSSSRIPGTDFGGPLGNERLNNITSYGSEGSRRVRGNPLTGYFQQVRSQRGDQLPVFMPTDSQLQRHLSTRFH